MLTLITRTLFTYVFVIIIFRLMGKRQIGQMQPFEFVLTLILADLATLPITDTFIPLVNGVLPVLLLAFVHFLISQLARINKKFSTVISGNPVIVIDPNGVKMQELEKLNISMDDLMELLRNCGFFNVEDVAFAIVETNGTMNAVGKSDVVSCNKGMFMESIIVSNGVVSNDEIARLKLKKSAITTLLKQNNTKLENVELLARKSPNEFIIQEKNKKAKTVSIKRGDA